MSAQDYHDTPPEDRKRAQVFFDRGRTVADTGNYEYAIEMYIQGLALDPEDVEAHKALREISLRRKASGGKDMGMFERRKFSSTTKDDKQNMLNAEKLLAYDPGNTDRMVSILQNALRGGFYETALWIGPILQKANADAKSPDFSKFIVLKDVYKELGQWKLATDACQYARRMKPEDMELATELKNLAAQDTMAAGGYTKGVSFRDSIRDKDAQQRLLEAEKDVQTEDVQARQIREAREAWEAEKGDPAKFTKLIDALRKTEQMEQENEAIELLDEMYAKTKLFRWRQKLGEIKIAQLSRMERAMRADYQANKDDAEKKKEYGQFLLERAQAELEEYQLIVQNYPTNSDARYEVGRRLFQLQRYQEAIQIFQNVRQDPKHRITATLMLGESFLQAGFPDEAVDTLREAIEAYPGRGDDRSKEMYYWYGRALEDKNDGATALKTYSQLVQWDFNYRDVQVRIKRLRGGGAAAQQQPAGQG